MPDARAPNILMVEGSALTWPPLRMCADREEGMHDYRRVFRCALDDANDLVTDINAWILATCRENALSAIHRGLVNLHGAEEYVEADLTFWGK